jgi:hypothetical protein
MKIVIHPAAQIEFDRKVDYPRLHGLLPNSAELFIDEIEHALHAIGHHPGKSRLPGSRRYFRFGPTARFSYSVIYQMSETAVEVLAIAAPQRRPGYWKRRRI